jgi:uncharacterized protein (TIRG00374 family)
LQIDRIITAFLSVKPIYILLALPLTLPRVIIRTSAWQLIQKEQKIHVGYWQSFQIFLIGYFYGSITPGYIGQLMRVPYLKEITREPYGKLFVNTLIETIVHTSSLYVMIIIGAALVISSSPNLFYLSVIWIFLFGLILLFFLKKERGETLFSRLIYYLIPSKVKVHFYQFIGTFYKDFPKVRNLLLPLFLGVFTWIIIFTQEYFIVLALDLSIPYHLFLLLFPVANVAGFLPISFAGLGTREAVAVLLFTSLFLVPDEEIFVVSLLGFLITDIFTGFIGFLISLTYMRKNGKRSRKVVI